MSEGSTPPPPQENPYGGGPGATPPPAYNPPPPPYSPAPPYQQPGPGPGGYAAAPPPPPVGPRPGELGERFLARLIDGVLIAIVNAIIDALDGMQIEMPATPEKLWRACQALGIKVAAE